MGEDPPHSANLSQSSLEIDQKPTKCRLIEAVLAMWADVGADHFSVRLLAAQADVAPSAIGYHFTNLERLYLDAADTALGRAQGWMGDTLKRLEGLRERPLSCAARAAVITGVIEDWTRAQRELAIAWRRGRSLGFAGFDAHWHEFWSNLAALLGLERHAATLALFADGESARHLLAWDPLLDHLLLEETVRALLAWLEHGRCGEDTARLEHRRLALAGYASPQRPRDAAEAAIDAAAAALFSEAGHAGLTFRALAQRAGVTLGTIITHCGTRSELLHRALHHLYEVEAEGGGPDGLAAIAVPSEVMIKELLVAVGQGDQAVLRAYDEIELAIYSDPKFDRLSGVVRSMEDPIGTWSLAQITGVNTPPASLVAAYSATVRGIGFMAGLAGGLSGAARAYAENGIAALAR